jgi:hypothetical protein
MSQVDSRLRARVSTGMTAVFQFDMRQHTELEARSSRVTPPKIHSPNRLCP